MDNVSITRIVTHVRPHLDEIAAIKILRDFGNKKFPGIRDATIEYVSVSGDVEGKTAQEHLCEGTLLVGLGGSIFDEHATPTKSRNQGESACSLVAKYLGVDKHPHLRHLIELVTKADQEGVSELHLASILKRHYRLRPDEMKEAIIMVSHEIDLYIDEQRLYTAAQQALQTDEVVTKVTPTGVRVVYVPPAFADNYKLPAAARSVGIDVLILHRETGHCLIFSNTLRRSFSMKFVVAALRTAEVAQKQGKKAAKQLDSSLMQQEGMVDGIWYYQVPGENVLNGSESRPDVEPTVLRGRQIFEIVCNNIYFERLKERA